MRRFLRKPAFGTTFNNSSAPSLLAQNTSALPWRRANVRHTSNELYADVVETLSVTLAPSGRPLAAFASGTIAFTSKVSGVPDIVVTLTGPSGKHNLTTLVDLPVFHPCVRLARWRERPGVLSFIPPDGRFILAGYEVDLLPFGTADTANRAASSGKLKLPVSLEIKTCLGPAGADFEVRLSVSRVLGSTSSLTGGRGASLGPPAGVVGPGLGGRAFGGAHAGTPASPSLQDLAVTIPLPADVRNLSEIRPTRGDATYNPGDRSLEWSIPAKDLASGQAIFGLRCTVVGPLSHEDDGDDVSDPMGFGLGFDSSYSYDDQAYQSSAETTAAEKKGKGKEKDRASAIDGSDRDERKVAQNKMLMPSSALVSFAVKGWLASGIKVESITIDARKSRGLSETVKPYKGVKYLTISKGGVEIRC